jgi:hypothetical protein
MRRDRRRDPGRRGAHELRRLARGDVLHHQLQSRKTFEQRPQHALEKHPLAIEDVDLGCGRLAMHQERHARLLHRFEHTVAARDIGHPGIGVGGCAGGIVLHCVHEAARTRARYLVGRRVVGQVERHQGLERHTGRQRRQDARSVLSRHDRCRDRWPQIRHDDRAGKARSRVRQYGAHRIAVAQMQVHIVGSGNRQLLGHGTFRSLFRPRFRPTARTLSIVVAMPTP